MKLDTYVEICCMQKKICLKNILQLRKHLVFVSLKQNDFSLFIETISKYNQKQWEWLRWHIKGVADKWCSAWSSACGVVVSGRLRCIVLRKCHWLITKLSLESNQPIWFTDHFLLKETNPSPVICHEHLTELLKDWFQPLLLEVRLPSTPRAS